MYSQAAAEAQAAADEAQAAADEARRVAEREAAEAAAAAAAEAAAAAAAQKAQEEDVARAAAEEATAKANADAEAAATAKAEAEAAAAEAAAAKQRENEKAAAAAEQAAAPPATFPGAGTMVRQASSGMFEDEDEDGLVVGLHGAVAKAPPASAAARFPLAALAFVAASDLPTGVDPMKREEALSDGDFLDAFGMGPGAFASLPKWKKDAAKKKLGLF